MTATDHTSSPGPPGIRVLCVDDHSLVREGIALILDAEYDIRVVASAATGSEAVTLFRQHRPDVTLMDLQLPVISGLDAIRAIRTEAADARIIVLTMYQGDEDIYQALQAGAATYLLKDTLSKDLVRIVREVHAGGRPMPAEIAASLANRPLPTVTAREREVLSLMAAGMRNKEIAAALRIAEETVHAHVKNIFSKLNVNDRTAAVSAALRRGIVHLEQ
jgi:DNA-binding NarL/FixJ family response regulator